MQLLKTFGLILLLTLSNMGIASTFNNSLPHFQEIEAGFQITEDQQDLFESTLITSAEVQSNRAFVSPAIVPEQMCPRRISQANGYYVYSRTIIPSLGITDIIFPFHSFL